MLCHQDGIAQHTELIVDFLQFVFLLAGGHDTSTCLKPQFVVAADEGPDGDGLIEHSVQTDEPDEGHLAAVVTEDDDIAEERIEHVRGVILRLAAVGDVDRLEMADGIVGRLAIEAAVASIVPGDIEPADKAAQGILGGELAVERLLLAGPVGEDIGRHAVADTDGSDGVKADEGAVVLRAVVVGAFEQDALQE